MVRANDDNTDSPEATSDTNKKKREPGRLTPMPDWLMHWWTPLLLAGILLAAHATPTRFLVENQPILASIMAIHLSLAIQGRNGPVRNNRRSRLRILCLAAKEPR